ncbi:hypothetical protein PQU94_17955 [Asticcacaulis sp. DXS10W]|uniref:Uncharacterized protein n=1 Tax=Asticcacaulis currens TaxID=2984210 RepID=A0ABT5IJ08_9CAUL|nr:hypothetical protein [Asticcacaulis currens]MDC7696164.1 hypothetical protein [Asticcacaulis currens]
MARYYITQAEAYLLSFLPSCQFHAEDRQLYHDHVSPRLIRDLLLTYDYEDAIAVLTYVIERIDIRHDRAKDRRHRYELACYRSWLANIRGQIENDYAPDRAVQRPSFMEAVKRVIARQAQP